MKRLIILTDEGLQFLISIPDLKNYISMDVNKISSYFIDRDYDVVVQKFSSLDLTNDYKGVYIIYQTSESPGSVFWNKTAQLCCQTMNCLRLIIIRSSWK